MELDVKHQWLKYYNVYVNHDPVMTLTQFIARSTWVAYAFEWGKLLKCHLKGKTNRTLANGQNINYSEKRKWPKGFICPCTGVKYHNHTCDSSRIVWEDPGNEDHIPASRKASRISRMLNFPIIFFSKLSI